MNKAKVIYKNVIFLMALLPMLVFAQDELVVPTFQENSTYLNDFIAGDTTATGDRVSMDRVYVLKREGTYLVNYRIEANGFDVRVKAEDGAGTRPVIYGITNATSGNFPGEQFRIEGDGGNLWLKDLIMVGFIETTPGELDANIPSGLIRTGATGFDIEIDGCLLTQTRGQHMRIQAACRVVKITNSIFTNMGDLGLSNFGAGKAIDMRDTNCDTLLLRNNTFVNFQDRIVRHRSSTGAINNFIFDHNTIINGMSYHGTLMLGWVGEHVQITNNLFYDTFIAGQDTDAVRQSEFDEGEELDAYGFAKMTWIQTVPNDSTQFTISNNFYTVSPEVQAFYDSITDPVFADEGEPLTDHIKAKAGVDENAFRKEALTLVSRPEPMIGMATWYRTPFAEGGAGKTKNTDNFVREDDDFDRKPWGYFDTEFNAGYAANSLAATGATDFGPVGDRNWDLVPVTYREVVVPTFAENSIYLNDFIAGDTTAGGERVDPNTMYVLKRDGIYLVNYRIEANGFDVNVKAEDGSGTRPVIYGITNATSGNFPGEQFRIEGEGGNLWLKDLIMVGFIEATPGELDANIPSGLIRTGATGFDITIDGCLLTQSRGQHMRIQAACRAVRITNSVFANMGDLGLSNFGAGKAIDMRDTNCELLLLQDNTFVNFQDRIIRHRSSTGAINNFVFDHNTIINGMSYHGTIMLGWVGDNVQITNNLFFDTFIAGQDTDAVRQSEFDEGEELDAYGFAKMTWIQTVPNEVTSFDISNNFYAVSDEVQAFYDSITDPVFADEGEPLTDHIKSKLPNNGADAFTKVALTVADRPDPMIDMAIWYRTPFAEGGAGKTKNTDNFVREDDDFDRRNWEYFDQTFNAGYPNNSPAASGDIEGGKVGDRNWDLISTALEQIGEQAPLAYKLNQNYPNPFNPTTQIDFQITKSDKVTLEVYNVIGQRVATLVNKKLNAGSYTVDWNASGFTSGIYFYKLTQGSYTITKKMILVK